MLIPTPPATYKALDANVPVFDEVLITTILPPTRIPPASCTDPAPIIVAAVSSLKDAMPATDKVDCRLAGPCKVESLTTFKFLPTNKSLATPIPPPTTNAPVVVEVALVVSVSREDPETSFTEPNVLVNVATVLDEDNTTFPTYKELPVR